MAGLRQALRLLAEASAPRRGELNAVRMFAGPLAKTADQEALSQAQRLAQTGAPREQIWNDTGWFQGVDGKWRFEIDDSAASFDAPVSFIDGRGPARLMDRLQHAPLADAYPEINPRLIPSGSSGGSLNPTVDEMGIPTVMPRRVFNNKAHYDAAVDNQRSVALHEAQHGIQQREGFAGGGAVDEFAQQDEAELARDAMSWRRELAKWRKEMPKADWIAVENRAVSEYQRMGAMDWLPSRYARDVARDTVGNPDEQLEALMRRYGTDVQVTPLTSREIYKRLAGEVEARNVQTRRDFTASERRAKPPWQTQDVPDDKQIVRFDRGRTANAIGDAIRLSAGLGTLGLAGDITLRQILRDNMQGQS